MSGLQTPQGHTLHVVTVCVFSLVIMPGEKRISKTTEFHAKFKQKVIFQNHSVDIQLIWDLH